MLEMDTLEASIAADGAQTFNLPVSNGVRVVKGHVFESEQRNEALLNFFVDPVSDVLGSATEVRWALEPDPGLWITRPTLNGVWIYLPIERFLPYSATSFVAGFVGLTTLWLVLSALFIRRFTRYLKRLEEAARRVGRGDPAMTLDIERGPKEVIAVNQAFNQMRKNLSLAKRERALLLAGISHDLRTPLTRMRLTTEFLGESDRELKEGMVRDIEDMDAILDQFIAFIRDGNDEPTDVGDINEVLCEIAILFQVEVGDIHTDLNPLPDISLKRLSLKRMFGNLVRNAVRHGGGEISISSGLSDGEICVIIADRGPGLSEQEMFALFQPFARGDKSRTTQGSGLGLAIVKRVVDMHHGRVELRNRKGGGLEACVYLPVTGELVPPDSMMTRI